MWFRLSLLFLFVFWLGCSSPTTNSQNNNNSTNVNTNQNNNTQTIEATAGVHVLFDTQGNWNKADTFFNFPWPSELRTTAEGRPNLTGFPNPKDNVLVSNLLKTAGDRPGFPVSPVGYFQFDEAIAKRTLKDVIKADPKASLLLIDVDPQSRERGQLFPLVASVMESGTYVPKHTLAVTPVPGVVVRANRLYAFVVMRSFNDAQGKPLGVPKALNQLKAGKAPDGAKGEALQSLYASLWETLQQKDINVADVAAATVFRTGDVVADLETLTQKLAAKHDLSIQDVTLAPEGDQPGFCVLAGTIEQPQFQRGSPPYPDQGLFEMDGQGIPKVQRTIKVPVILSIPKKTMPKDGYPLMLFLHGSGGRSRDIVDRGRITKSKGPKTPGDGPARMLAMYGIAGAGSAMPINPERVPGAQSRAYLNVGNLSAYRDTFRQGTFETYFFISALLKLRIKPEVLAACKGPTLPSGNTEFRFSEKNLALMGQSMGSQYAAMIGAIDKRLKALIPSGAGGHWSYFIVNSGNDLLNPQLLQTLLDSQEALSFVHPVLHMLHMSWDVADPLTCGARVAHDPLPGHSPRQIYLPMGQSDSFFPEDILDIMAIGYGVQQAGKEVWPETQKLLAWIGMEGIASYPIANNRKSLGKESKAFTGVTVQYAPDSVTGEGHYVTFQLDDARFQYACFLDTLFRTGTAVVPQGGKPGDPCPTK